MQKLAKEVMSILTILGDLLFYQNKALMMPESVQSGTKIAMKTKQNATWRKMILRQ